MRYEILATGSTGNCVIINDTIAIDMGVPYKTIEPYLGKLQLVLLTHLHSDHFNPRTIRRMAYEKPSLRFGCCVWMVPYLLKKDDKGRPAVKPTQIDVFEPDKWGQYNGAIKLLISPIKLTHNVANCGWKIFHGGEAAIYATDTGTLDGIEAKGYDLYMIEANHTRAELEARLAEKEANGEYAYERRAAENHLSYEQAVEWLTANMGPNSLWVPMHGHKEKEVSVNAGTEDACEEHY